jgi:hypothetical protein
MQPRRQTAPENRACSFNCDLANCSAALVRVSKLTQQNLSFTHMRGGYNCQSAEPPQSNQCRIEFSAMLSEAKIASQ